MAPTTLLNQKTTTTPFGRNQINEGNPVKVSEILAGLPGVKYVERTSVSSPKEVLKTKKAIRMAFQNQINNNGFSLVEVLSMCPTCWGLSTDKSARWIEEEMVKTFPLGRIK